MPGSGSGRDVVVLGGGATGLATALLLARAGHRVTVVDREGPPPDGHADTVFDSWDRHGVGHFRQPHNFLGRAQQVLRDHLPDVRADLDAAGAGRFDQSTLLDVGGAPDGDLMGLLLIRRPVYDAVFRRACEREPGVTARTGVVASLLVDPSGQRVTGVGLADGSSVTADLVVDALGRTSPVPGWVESMGLAKLDEDRADCGLLYYSRHYRFRDGLPSPASVMFGPRGDTGYLAFATFVGDHDTASLALMISTEDKDLRALRDSAAFDTAVGLIPPLADWLHPDVAETTTDVLPMGALRDVRRRWTSAAGPGVPGLMPVGDALCHTNPTFALGASQALEHAVALRDALEVSDDDEVAARYADAVDAVADARWAAISAEDADRRRLWRGEIDSPIDRDAAPAMYLRAAVYAVAGRDPELGIAVLRRIHGLDPIDRLPSDTTLMERAAALIGDGSSLPLPSYPSRSDLVEAVVAAGRG